MKIAEEIAKIFWDTYHTTGGNWDKAANAAAAAMHDSGLSYGAVKQAIMQLMSESAQTSVTGDWVSWALAHYTVMPMKE